MFATNNLIHSYNTTRATDYHPHATRTNVKYLLSSFYVYQTFGIDRNMEAVHFTTIPCLPNTANWQKESHVVVFLLTCPYTNNIVYARFEVFRTFLCVFMNVLSVSFDYSYE